MFKGVEFRFHERHQSNGKGPKSKPEAYVAFYKDGKVWVRDNGKGGLSLGNNDEGKMIKHERITLWLPAFVAETKVECNIIIKKCLSDFAAEHPDGLNTDISTTSDKNGSDTPSVYTTAQSDPDILQLYHSDDSVPDEKAATLIGEAKGRAHGTAPVPASVVMAAKRNALDGGLESPWDSMVYCSHLEYVRGSLECVRGSLECVRGSGRKRKRSVTPPPLEEKLERYKAIVDDYHAKKAERWDFLRKSSN